jgi:serine/threonine protein kinase/Tol biopolymer transport system component
MSDTLIGKTLSHFRVIDRIGAGGMGVVYRARDEQLRRDVAIKVLPPEALADEAARKRFRHEALTLSRLNHPNIETVLGFETQDGLDFLIVEYVDGESLEERLRCGPMQEEEAVSLAISVAEALEAAHSKGVIHCDLKPANVGVTSEGRVKVLDFGVAQVLRSPRDDTSTWTALEGTGGGGTLPYMAPEQLLGKRVDGRVDLYALGVLLFRMAAGCLPFNQPLPTALADEILHRPPPNPRNLNPKLSAQLESVILRCLEKDPANRYQTAADLRADLGRVKRDTDPSIMDRGTAIDFRSRRGWVGRWPRWSLALVAAAVVAMAALWIFVLRPRPVPTSVLPDRQVTYSGQASQPAISPDGQYAAYVDRGRTNEDRLFVQDLSGGEPLQVFSAQACFRPRWSPDGSTILCHAVRQSDDAAYLVPKLGGTPRRLPSGGHLHSWAPDGRRFVSASSTARRLLLTDTATGDTSSIPLERFSARIVDVEWAPRGDRIVLLAADDHDRYSFWTMVPGRGGIQKWFDDSSEACSPRWSPDGEAVYFLRVAGQGGLKDLCRIRWTSRPSASLRPDVIVHGLAAGDYFTLSRDGRRLLYTREASRSNLWMVEIAEFHRDPSRGEKVLTTGTSFDSNPAVSPDGKWVAFARGAGPLAEIFRVSVDGGEAQQLTFMSSGCRSPVWSASGDTIAIVSNKGGIHRLWRVAATGGPARPYPGIEVSDHPLAPLAWAPGQALLCEVSRDRGYVLLDPSTGATSSIGSPDSLGLIVYPQFSPDGARIAWWTADPRGVWIMTLADHKRVCVLRDGPVLPLAWARTGRWIFGADMRAARPRLLRFSSEGAKGEDHVEIPNWSEISVSSDGMRAVCAVNSHQPDVWLAEDFDRRGK